MGMTIWLGMLSHTLFTQVNHHLSLQLDLPYHDLTAAQQTAMLLWSPSPIVILQENT